MATAVEFRRPLSGALYRSFLLYSRTIAHSICMIVPDGTQSNEIVSVLARLRPWLLSQVEVREWPGTRIEDPAETAVRYAYELSEEVVGLVGGFADQVYAWQSPGLPEDPHIVRADGSLWFGSTTTEGWSWLEPRPDELENLLLAAPGIDALLSQSSG